MRAVCAVLTRRHAAQLLVGVGMLTTTYDYLLLHTTTTYYYLLTTAIGRRRHADAVEA